MRAASRMGRFVGRTQPARGVTGILGVIAAIAAVCAVVSAQRSDAPDIVLDHVRLIDGTGTPPRDDMRVVVRGARIVEVGAASNERPQGTYIDLRGRTLMPGLIDLHFHIERDPKLAIRQLANGVTSFRDPGQWNEYFEPLKALMKAEHLPGPRMALAGPHIDGEHPAYPADSVVARDPDEARAAAERNVAEGASAIKIYFRLPLASAKAVIGVCHAHGVPCLAHLEVTGAVALLEAGLDGIEHVTSFGVDIVPRRRAEQYRQQVLLDNRARGDGRYALFADADLDGPEAARLYRTLEATHPFLNPTLAVFEVQKGHAREGAGIPASVDLRGYAAMKQLAHRAFEHGARVTLGGHSTVPFAGRGEAPWRELELLVDAGFTPLQALTAATATGAASLRRSEELGTVEPGKLADLVVLRRDPSVDIHAIRTVERVMSNGTFIAVERYRTW